MYLYVFGVKHRGGWAARRCLWLSQELEEEAIHQLTFTELPVPHSPGSVLLPPVLPFMGYLLWCWCPARDWSPTAISGTWEWPSGRICKEPAWKQKQKLEGILWWAWDKGTSEPFVISLAKQSKQSKKSIRKYSASRDLKETSHFTYPINTIPSPCKKTNVFVRGGEEGRKEEKEINGEREGGGRRGGTQGERWRKWQRKRLNVFGRR